MGFNTTVVIYNDSLNEIRDDKEFGKKLYDAIMRNWSSRKPECIDAGNSDAGYVIEQHHSSIDVFVKVGGNIGEIVDRKQVSNE